MLNSFAHKILNIDPICMKPVPIESSHSDLSIGTGFIQIGSILRHLWGKQKCPFLKGVSKLMAQVGALKENGRD